MKWAIPIQIGLTLLALAAGTVICLRAGGTL